MKIIFTLLLLIGTVSADHLKSSYWEIVIKKTLISDVTVTIKDSKIQWLVKFPIVIDGEVKAFRHVTYHGIIKDNVFMINEVSQSIYLAIKKTKELDLGYTTLKKTYYEKVHIKSESKKLDKLLYYTIKIGKHTLTINAEDEDFDFVEILK